jgi:hypothetical protein
MRIHNNVSDDGNYESDVEHELTETDLSQKELVEDIKLLVSNYSHKQLISFPEF